MEFKQFKEIIESRTDYIAIQEDNKILIGKYYNNEFEPTVISPKFGWRKLPMTRWMHGVLAGVEIKC